MALPISSVSKVLLIVNLLPAVMGTWLPFPRGYDWDALEILSKSSLHFCSAASLRVKRTQGEMRDMA